MSDLALPKPPRRLPAPRKRITRGSAPKRKAPTKRESARTLARLKRALWKLVAAYVRRRDGDVCVTCGARANQAGHFFSRRIASTWVDPKNLGAQCPKCNLYLHGNPGAFADYILRHYGSVELARLTSKARELKKWTEPELLALIAAIKRGPAEYECAYYEAHL